jgi:Ca2+-binding RTX toxin-like protein
MGGWGGAIDTSAGPQHMTIDYIRSYALADGSTVVQGPEASQGDGSAFATTTSAPAAAGTGSSTPVSPPPVSPPPVTTSPPPVSPPPVTSTSHAFTSIGGDSLTGTAGADTFTAGAAPTTITGGGGDDHFVFTAEPWAPTHITDFTVGHDVLDLSALLSTAGYHGTDPVADHYVILQSDGNGGTEVLFDPDGTATAHQWPDYIINLDHTTASSWADLQGAATTTVSPPPVSPPPVSPPPVSPPPVSPPPVSPPPVSPPPASSGGGGSTGTTPVTAAETLAGHAGGDTLQGGAGDDHITGFTGTNLLTGGDGNDQITGGTDFNSINGNKGDDTIVSHSLTGDWLLGGQGNDMIDANAGSNLVYGNLGNDTLHGGSGYDIIRGGQGDDSITAGSGPQWISGDRGSDTIQGGTGADTFHSSAGAGMDVVYGFDASKGDHVQLDPGTHYTLTQSGADTLIDMGNGDEMVLKNVTFTTLPSGWLFGS